jgi:hypothetical protein
MRYYFTKDVTFLNAMSYVKATCPYKGYKMKVRETDEKLIEIQAIPDQEWVENERN